MKSTSTPFLTFAFFALVFSFLTLNSEAKKLPILKVIFGTRSHPNGQGSGCEGEKGVCFIGSSARSSADENTGVAELTIAKNAVILNILEDRSPASENEDMFYLYEPKELSEEDCRELGFSKIVLLPGEYQIDKSRNPLGTIRINAEID